MKENRRSFFKKAALTGGLSVTGGFGSLLAASKKNGKVSGDQITINTRLHGTYFLPLQQITLSINSELLKDNPCA